MLIARDQPNIFLLHMFSSFSFSSLLLRPSNFFLQILNYLTRTGSVRVRRLLYGGCAFVKHCVQYHSLSPSHHRYYHQHVHLGRHYHCHQWVGSGQALCAACPRGGTGQDQPGGGLIMECLLYKPGKCWPGLAFLLDVWWLLWRLLIMMQFSCLYLHWQIMDVGTLEECSLYTCKIWGTYIFQKQDH